MRLGKYLSRCGVASRRASEAIIGAGRVRVNGVVVTDPARGVDSGDAVTVDRKPVAPERVEVWMLNKPPNVISTADDPGGRQTVVSFISSDSRLYPVGRLDADSTGLILIANDGPLANHLIHPRYEVSKTYLALLKRTPTSGELVELRHGPVLDDGPTNPLSVTRKGRREIEIVIGEGRNRQVRRMVEAVGNEVVELTRTHFGTLSLGSLEQGQARKLGQDEVARLWKDGVG